MCDQSDQTNLSNGTFYFQSCFAHTFSMFPSPRIFACFFDIAGYQLSNICSNCPVDGAYRQEINGQNFKKHISIMN